MNWLWVTHTLNRNRGVRIRSALRIEGRDEVLPSENPSPGRFVGVVDGWPGTGVGRHWEGGVGGWYQGQHAMRYNWWSAVYHHQRAGIGFTTWKLAPSPVAPSFKASKHERLLELLVHPTG